MAGVSFDLINADWYSRNGFPGIRAALGGGNASWSGESVGLATSLNHSVVWACNRVISEPLGFLPLVMMQETASGKNPALKHPLYNVMRWAVNDEQTSMAFRETATSHMVLQGNTFSKINRRSGTGAAIGFDLLQPSQFRLDRNAKKQKVYLFKDGNDPEKTYTVIPGKPQDILHVPGIGLDGMRGLSVIEVARQSFGSSIAAEKYAGRFYYGGGRVPYVLTLDQKFKSQDEFDKFRADWEATYKEPHKAPILEGGLKYQQIGMSNADAQFLQTRQFNIPEICRWFQVSPHLVGDLSRATFSNIEQLALEFVKMSLTAWMTRWEHELWKSALTDDEKSAGYYFNYDVSGLLRGDFATRMAGYATGLQNGIYSIDEVRDKEQMNPLPNSEGEHHIVQLNMQDVENIGKTPPAPVQQPGIIRPGAQPEPDPAKKPKPGKSAARLAAIEAMLSETRGPVIQVISPERPRKQLIKRNADGFIESITDELGPLPLSVVVPEGVTRTAHRNLNGHIKEITKE
jgi:HK97 family phage portal protein